MDRLAHGFLGPLGGDWRLVGAGRQGRRRPAAATGGRAMAAGAWWTGGRRQSGRRPRPAGLPLPHSLRLPNKHPRTANR